MAQTLSDAEGFSLLLLVGSVAVVAWIASGRLAKSRGWGRLARWALGCGAVLMGFTTALCVGVVFLAMGSWPMVLAGSSGAAALLVFREPVARFARVVWSRYIAVMDRLLPPPAARQNKAPAHFDLPSQNAPQAMSFRHVVGQHEQGPFEVSFRYIDANGGATDRRISAIWFGQYKVDAYCHHRMAERSFRYDRIVGDVLDVETGELLSVDQWKAICLDEAEH